jgi:hypothetical protein
MASETVTRFWNPTALVLGRGPAADDIHLQTSCSRIGRAVPTPAFWFFKTESAPGKATGLRTCPAAATKLDTGSCAARSAAGMSTRWQVPRLPPAPPSARSASGHRNSRPRRAFI